VLPTGSGVGLLAAPMLSFGGLGIGDQCAKQPRGAPWSRPRDPCLETRTLEPPRDAGVDVLFTFFGLFCTSVSNTSVPVKRHRVEPGHTRDTRNTRTHKGTQTNLTTNQTHQQHTPRTSARRPVLHGSVNAAVLISLKCISGFGDGGRSRVREKILPQCATIYPVLVFRFSSDRR